MLALPTMSLSAASPTALQRFDRGKCVYLLHDVAAAADLLPHSALFSRQLLDLTDRWWSEAQDPVIDDPLAAAAFYWH